MVHDWVRDPRVLARGGIADPGRLTTSSTRLCELARSSFGIVCAEANESRGAPGPDELALLFVNSEAANAALLGAGCETAIVLHIGLLEAFDGYVKRAIEDPVFLSRYLPRSNDPDFDRSAREVTVRILLHMVDFVLHHEIAHYLRDHLSLLSQRSDVRELDEALALHSIAAGDDLPRMLEFDADLHALDLQIGSMALRAPLEAWPEGELEDALFLLLLAMILCCQVLDRQHTPIRRRGSVHPAPVHRAILYSETVVESFAAVHPSLRPKLESLHDAAWYEASLAARAHGMPKGRWHGTAMNDARFELLLSERPRVIRFCEGLDKRSESGHLTPATEIPKT